MHDYYSGKEGKEYTAPKLRKYKNSKGSETWLKLPSPGQYLRIMTSK